MEVDTDPEMDKIHSADTLQTTTQFPADLLVSTERMELTNEAAASAGAIVIESATEDTTNADAIATESEKISTERMELANEDAANAEPIVTESANEDTTNAIAIESEDLAPTSQVEEKQTERNFF